MSLYYTAYSWTPTIQYNISPLTTTHNSQNVTLLYCIPMNTHNPMQYFSINHNTQLTKCHSIVLHTNFITYKFLTLLLLSFYIWNSVYFQFTMHISYCKRDPVLYRALLVIYKSVRAERQDGCTRGAETCCCYKWFNYLLLVITKYKVVLKSVYIYLFIYLFIYWGRHLFTILYLAAASDRKWII